MVELLPWDTEFFKRPVYKIASSVTSEIDTALEELPVGSLCYIFSEYQLPSFAPFLMDEKIIFSAPVSQDLSTSEEGSSLPVGKLYELAIISSQHSRFRVDKLIPEMKTDDLYHLWIDRALAAPERYKIVSREGGMALISYHQGFDSIDLIAVHPSAQRNGVGTWLLRRVFMDAAQRKILRVQVTTQRANLRACEFYRKNGFSELNSTFVYHFHKLKR